MHVVLGLCLFPLGHSWLRTITFLAYLNDFKEMEMRYLYFLEYRVQLYF
jgi:hypothetical protein